MCDVAIVACNKKYHPTVDDYEPIIMVSKLEKNDARAVTAMVYRFWIARITTVRGEVGDEGLAVAADGPEIDRLTTPLLA